MNNHRTIVAGLPFPRRFPRTAFLFLSLTAVIVGILAMHVWMGGHGATHATGPAVTAPPAAPVHQQELTSPAPAPAPAVAGVALNLDCADTAVKRSPRVCAFWRSWSFPSQLLSP